MARITSADDKSERQVLHFSRRHFYCVYDYSYFNWLCYKIFLHAYAITYMHMSVDACMRICSCVCLCACKIYLPTWSLRYCTPQCINRQVQSCTLFLHTKLHFRPARKRPRSDCTWPSQPAQHSRKQLESRKLGKLRPDCTTQRRPPFRYSWK